MKRVSVFMLLMLIPFQHLIAQSKVECNCFEMGIDTVWASSQGVKCYRVGVKQTLGKNNGDIHLATIVASRTGSKDAGPLLYLHGGPGISTLSNAKKYLNGKDWKKLREEHDIIMFDYRGTGFSEPSICEAILDSLKNFKRTNPSPEVYAKRELEQYLQCRNQLDSLKIDVQSFNSIQMASDADEIRKAFLIEDWNVYGVSYGTLVGLNYIRKFPTHLRSVVLDSPFPPNASSFDFISSMNETLTYMQGKLLEDSSTAYKFPDIIKDFSTTASKLNANPIKIDNVNFTGNDFAWAMLMSFYNSKLVHLIPLGLMEFAKGDTSLLKDWVMNLSSLEKYGKLNAIQSALITCYECKPRKPEEHPDTLKSRYPYLAALADKEFMDLCFKFRPETPEPGFYESVKSDLPVMVIGGEFDPGTPPSFGRATAESLTNSTLIIVPNASHAAMGYNDCTFSLVESFLKDPFRKPDVNCIQQIVKIKFAMNDLDGELKKLLK